MKICYVSKNFGASALDVVDKANKIIAEYTQKNLRLTLRQLYYQFVARDFIANTIKSYKRLGSIINDARLCGLISWHAIEDRTREVQSLAHWESPDHFMKSVAPQFRVDKWQDQEYRPEVWVEKEALAGVMEQVCRRNDIPYLSCRGYTSQSEMWGSAMRLKEFQENGQTPVILHFGDHDPSGIDMSRDILDRLRLFGLKPIFKRLALNMKQIDEYTPPPNPAKTTDSRYASYRDEFGEESWELDALEPTLLIELVQEEVDKLRDDDKYNAWLDYERVGRGQLQNISDNYDDVLKYLKDKKKRNGR